jgi:hypothetical protein
MEVAHFFPARKSRGIGDKRREEGPFFASRHLWINGRYFIRIVCSVGHLVPAEELPLWG